MLTLPVPCWSCAHTSLVPPVGHYLPSAMNCGHIAAAAVTSVASCYHYSQVLAAAVTFHVDTSSLELGKLGLERDPKSVGIGLAGDR